MLDYKQASQQSIKMRGEREARTASIHAILLDSRTFILQKQGKERWGWGVWLGGLTGTPIDMSSFYLANEFFFSSELRRHSETTLHHSVSPLTDENV